MERVDRNDCPVSAAAGMQEKIAFGTNGLVNTDEAVMSFVTVAASLGKMTPLTGTTKVFYVEKTEDAWIVSGRTPETLTDRKKLYQGQLLCAGAGDWYTFEFDSEDGFADLITFTSVPIR